MRVAGPVRMIAAMRVIAVVRMAFVRMNAFPRMNVFVFSAARRGMFGVMSYFGATAARTIGTARLVAVTLCMRMIV